MSNKSLTGIILFLLVLCVLTFGAFYLKTNPELAISQKIFGGAVYDTENSVNNSNSPFINGQNNSNVDSNTVVATSNQTNSQNGVTVQPEGTGAETVFPNTGVVPTTTTTNNTETKDIITRTLKKGSKGADVKSVQAYLIKEKYLTGSADGSYGAMTETAVKKFQTEYSIKADGVISGETMSLLNELLSA